MELNEFKDPDSCKIFKLVVDFLYEKNLTQFIENKNEYKPSDFCLKKFTKMLDKNNETEKDINVVYKCYMIYCVDLISKFINSEISDLLVEIYEIVCEENLVFSIPISFTVTCELKIACLKMMKYYYERFKLDANCQKFRNILESNDFNGEPYISKDHFYNDICVILSKDDRLRQRTLLATVLKILDEEKISIETTEILINSLKYSPTAVVDENDDNDVIEIYSNDSNKEIKNKQTNDTRNERGINFKKIKKWTLQELLYLVYFARVEEKSWVEISTKHKEYFNNRSNIDLAVKYYYLENDKTRLEDLKKKAKSLTQIKNSSKSNEYEKQMYLKWNEKETIHMICGVKLHGENWRLIFEQFRKHFKDKRRPLDLRAKYYRLNREPTRLDYYCKKADLLMKQKLT